MKRISKPALFFSLAVVPALWALLGGCVAPDNTYLMELNRNGKWREAERIGEDMLVHRSNFTHSQICDIYLEVMYAKTRMGKNAEAVKMMTEYDAIRYREKIDPSLLWLDREVAKLKDELGLLNEVQRTLTSAMAENEAGNFTRARELCTAVLAMKTANDMQQAIAHFVAAVCAVRLKDAGEAEAHLAVFATLKSALPPTHQLFSEEPYVRQGLQELKQLQQK